MINATNDKLVLLFKAETREQLERFVAVLLELEQDPAKQRDVINELFRLAHNIKGSSGVMGLNELKETMHMVENLFDGVRKTALELDPEKIDMLLQYCDDVLNYVESGRWEQVDRIIRWKDTFNFNTEEKIVSVDRYNTVLALSAEEKQTIAAWQAAGKSVYGVEVQFSLDAQMKSASALVFVKYLEKYGAIYKTAPPIKELAAEKFDIFKIVLIVDSPLTLEQESTITTYPVNDALEIRMRKWVYRPEEARTKFRVEHMDHAITSEKIIRVESSKIDRLINDIGELLSLKANLNQIIQSGYQGPTTWGQLAKTIRKLDQFTANFQTNIMDLRMVPVRQLFSRFPKIVRDIAKLKQKQVELTIFGEDTEIDKQVAENLIDPLTHLLRNAIDHGLESADRRSAIGKPETGRITLGAYQEGDYIVVSVSDDGEGLNLNQIKEKAIKTGLIKTDVQLDDAQIYELIFHPGFSTAEEVNDISGRGVGLDVVLSSINSLKGDIEIDTEPNRGTTFRLKVPLTLAIIQSLMVKIGGQTFGIPSADVVESLMIAKNQLRQVADRMVYTLRQEVLPVIDLRGVFELENSFEFEQMPMVVIKTGRTKMGLLVEELIGQEQIVIKQINPALPDNPIIAGATILGDGEIALIIDSHNLQ